MTIRDASAADAQLITALCGELGYAATSEAIAQRLSHLLGQSNQRIRVAVCEGQIAGWAQASVSEVLESGHRVEIVGLIVGEQFRRQGVGRELVRDIEDWARSLGVSAVVVRSNVSRHESHQFYPALGFKPVKTQAVYRKSLV